MRRRRGSGGAGMPRGERSCAGGAGCGGAGSCRAGSVRAPGVRRCRSCRAGSVRAPRVRRRRELPGGECSCVRGVSPAARGAAARGARAPGRCGSGGGGSCRAGSVRAPGVGWRRELPGGECSCAGGAGRRRRELPCGECSCARGAGPAAPGCCRAGSARAPEVRVRRARRAAARGERSCPEARARRAGSCRAGSARAPKAVPGAAATAFRGGAEFLCALTARRCSRPGRRRPRSVGVESSPAAARRAAHSARVAAWSGT